MTAGLYAARARLNTRLVEKISPGGQVLTTDWVDNYPGFPEGVSGFELVDRMRKQAERFGLEIVRGEVTRLSREDDWILVHMTEGGLRTRAVIVATGTIPVKLGIPGEIEYTGKGVSYCATCDGPFYRGVEVAVVGGGDTAVEEALYLTRFASKVHLFHRRDQLRATGILREAVTTHPKIQIHWSTVLTEIHADDRKLVRGVTHQDLKTGQTGQLPVEGVFLFVGQTPTTSFLQGFLELAPGGYVDTDLEMATAQPGVWAAGDVRSKVLRQIVTAAGDGATAAFNAEKYIETRFGYSHAPKTTGAPAGVAS